MISKKKSILHSLQVRNGQEDSLVIYSAEIPDTVGVVMVVVGVVRAGEVARAKETVYTGVF